MSLNKLFVKLICFGVLSFTGVASATELEVTDISLQPISQAQEILETERVNYGLIPNPFKIIKKTAGKAIKKAATAPLKATKARIKAAKKAINITRRAVDSLPDSNTGSDVRGSTDYEKTPYTKDRFYRNNVAKTNKLEKSTHKNYENYEFNYKEPAAINTDTIASPKVIIVEEKTTKPNTTIAHEAITNQEPAPVAEVAPKQDVAAPAEPAPKQNAAPTAEPAPKQDAAPAEVAPKQDTAPATEAAPKNSDLNSKK